MTGVGYIDIARALAAAAKKPRAAGAKPKARGEAVAMIEKEMLAAPAFTYRTLPVREVHGELLDFGDALLRAPGLEPFSSQLTAVTAVVCTLGPALEARISALCAGRKLSLALALDEVGNELLFYTVRHVTLLIRGETRRRGLSAGATFSPGCRDLPLDQQAGVIAMAGGERLGITVTEKGMLFPVKSRSLVVGIGMGLSAPPLHRRCDTCSSRDTCRYRAL
jgi:hypothetical protein